ncbi:helix-turn-helix domain-containing protein [Nocardia transvalensis]|uniref:helix-turn-helix domain-containing protein n=1 Tax=Nocardia transvalensis TaxID=37333 RepID=UPI00189428F9|nr:helix-turn-helix transcriptional regulator [Nocardia transvalensis]
MCELGISAKLSANSSYRPTRERPTNDHFRSLRLAHGWTQAELAERVCVEIERITGHRPPVDAQAISRIECGEISWPRRATRQALMALFGRRDGSSPRAVAETNSA